MSAASNLSLSATSFQFCCGVDISARTFTAAFPATSPTTASHSKTLTVATYQQTSADFLAFRGQLLQSGAQPADILVVMEATGTYWVRLATELHQAGFAVSVINPQQAHHFAKAALKRVKSDALDAQTLLELASALKLPCWSPPPQIYYELQQRLAHRDNLLDLTTQVTNQLLALRAGAVLVSAVEEKLEALLLSFEAQVKALEKELEEIVKNHPHHWLNSIKLLESIPGIGLITACLVIVLTHNFADFKNGSAASHYAGLAPLERSSGTSLKGRARLRAGGNSRLRRALYMAALSASRYNPAIKALYERLRGAGKPMKVARCAAARKLLVQAYAVVKTGTPFDASYQTRQTEKKLAKAS